MEQDIVIPKLEEEKLREVPTIQIEEIKPEDSTVNYEAPPEDVNIQLYDEEKDTGKLEEVLQAGSQVIFSFKRIVTRSLFIMAPTAGSAALGALGFVPSSGLSTVLFGVAIGYLLVALGIYFLGSFIAIILSIRLSGKMLLKESALSWTTRIIKSATLSWAFILGYLADIYNAPTLKSIAEWI